MRFCARCILPDTRPGISLDADGVCTACRGHDQKMSHIDWNSRAEQLAAIVEQSKRRARGYDCVVPVSGGKDSWYQVLRCRELGLKVLGITWSPPGRTELGQSNLDGLIENLRIDHIDYRIDPSVERRFTKAAFETKGSSAIPMHMALFAIPVRLAVQLRIPLVVWGENPQLEFGGTAQEQLATDLDAEWIRRHGVTNSTQADDWIGVAGLTQDDLTAYRLPDADEADFAPRSIFLGAFEPWNSFENARIAAEHGFRPAPESRTGVWNFADVDDRYISIHHFLKWYKFGFTRAFDNLSVQIRFGMIERSEALEEVRRRGLQTPHDDIQAFCEFVGEPEEWFWSTAERFRNESIWVREAGTWRLPGFPIEEWAW